LGRHRHRAPRRQLHPYERERRTRPADSSDPRTPYITDPSCITDTHADAYLDHASDADWVLPAEQLGDLL
jgi:hypothetical protein